MSAADSLERPTAAVPAAASLLRVYGGRLNGAEQELGGTPVVRIGHHFDNELVLRGRGTAGIALALHVDGPAVRLQVLSGTVTLLGCPVEAGGWALLPPYVPVQMGQYAIAIGEVGSARWSEVPALVAAPGETPPAQESSVPGSSGGGVGRWLGSEAEAISRRVPPARRPLLLMGAAAVLALLVVVPAGVRELRDTINGPPAVEARLAEAGFGALRVREDPATGALIVNGRVRDDRAVERVRAVLGKRFGPVTLNLDTLSGTASALTGLLQSQGVDAEAVSGADGIVVHTEFLPADRLAALRTRIAADLPEAGPIRFVRDRDRGPRDLQYFFASDRFGLASLVDGDPGHIVTADGQYWFAGALLPTGHRLVSVGNGEVRFERDGLVESLRVVPTGGQPSAHPGPQPSAPPASLASQPNTTAATSLFSNAG